MNHYLIEFRFHGKAKFEIKKLIREITNKFILGDHKVVPHITLAGPLFTNNEGRLLNDFNKLCEEGTLMGFEIDGFSTFRDKRVIYLKIRPYSELVDFRWRLYQTIKNYCQLSEFDHNNYFAFHTTLAFKLSENKFSEIMEFIKNQPPLRFKHIMVRATLLRNGFILAEYDFLLHRLLNRSLAKDKAIYAQTLNLLQVHFGQKV